MFIVKNNDINNLGKVFCVGLHTSTANYKIIGSPGGDGGNGIRGGGGSGFDKTTTSGIGSNGNGSNKDKNFLCPNCGNICTQIEEFLCKCCLIDLIKINKLTISASTRFVKCDKCARFFVILSENDYSKSTKENLSPNVHKPSEKFNVQRAPPPPKKVCCTFNFI